ncbi:uncharacterized protein METZ01_LOCUS257524, partial [marine metagenome]
VAISGLLRRQPRRQQDRVTSMLGCRSYVAGSSQPDVRWVLESHSA